MTISIKKRSYQNLVKLIVGGSNFDKYHTGKQSVTGFITHYSPFEVIEI